MITDVTPITNAILQVAGVAIIGFGGALVTWAYKKLGIQETAATQATWNTALDNAVTYGVQASQATIAAKGWDHIDTHDAIIQSGLDYLVAHTPDALHAVGLSTNMADPGNVKALEQALQRALPAAVRVAAASPATPPAGLSSAVVQENKRMATPPKGA